MERRADIVGTTGYVLPTFGRTDDGGRPHIEVNARGYHYVVVERGKELSRITTGDPDDLLYHVFADVSFSQAMKFEVGHRIKQQDFRRILFKHQIELLSSLSPAWVQRQLAEHNRILQDHPFDNFLDIRARFTKELRDAGHSADDAWRAARQRYPLPHGEVV